MTRFSDDRAKALGIEKVSLDELFSRSDFITIHTPLPLKQKTHKFRDHRENEKESGLLTAQGGIINEKDMYEALKSGRGCRRCA